MFRPVDENLSLSATRRVEHPALKSGDETVSYRSLNRLVDSIAAFLQRNLGLTPGERVLLLLSNGLEFVTAYYAVMRAGGVVVPVNPRSVPREISHYLDDSEPHLAVARLDSLAHVPLETCANCAAAFLSTNRWPPADRATCGGNGQTGRTPRKTAGRRRP